MKADTFFQCARMASTAGLSWPTDNSALPLEEDSFHQVLALERKRAERSGNPSLLLTLDLRGIHTGSDASAYKIFPLLRASIRDTDLVGWYKYGAVLGVIFTELGDSEPIDAKEKIVEKIQGALRDSLAPSKFNQIRIGSEFLAPTSPWSRNGNGQLHLQPMWAESEDAVPMNRGFDLGQLPLSTAWFLMSVDIFVIALAHFIGIWALIGGWMDFLQTYILTCTISIFLYPISLYVFDLYNLQKIRNPRLIAFRTALASFPVVAVCTILYYVVPQLQYSRSVFALQLILTLGFLMLWRTVYSHLSQTAKGKLPVLILGSGETAQMAMELLDSQVSPFEYKGFVDDDSSFTPQDSTPETVGSMKQLSRLTRELGIKAVVLAMPRNRSNRITRKILEIRMGGVEVIDMPTLCERLAQRVPVKYIEDQWLLFSNGFYLLSREYVQRMKRILDIFFSAMLLLFSFPLMLLTAAVIRIDSPGPVFYKQQRVGRGCKVFTVHKFRSMCYNAEEHGAKWAQKEDPRVTRVGKWIRLFRIDELPQIWNVFTGDMSLVGPRPERPEFVKELDSQIPYYTVRHTVRPGITGWAQIKYPYGASIEDSLRKLEYDLFYIKNMSLLLDLKIMLRTVGVVLLGEGAR